MCSRPYGYGREACDVTRGWHVGVLCSVTQPSWPAQNSPAGERQLCFPGTNHSLRSCSPVPLLSLSHLRLLSPSASGHPPLPWTVSRAHLASLRASAFRITQAFPCGRVAAIALRASAISLSWSVPTPRRVEGVEELLLSHLGAVSLPTHSPSWSYFHLL